MPSNTCACSAIAGSASSQGPQPSALQHAGVNRSSVTALKQSGMKFEQDWMFEGDHMNHMISGGRFAAERIFAAANPPTAVICSNDLTAVGMLHMAHQLGRKIPEDLSLIGFDDLFIAEIVQPALTTLHLSRREIAARVLCSAIGPRQNTCAANVGDPPAIDRPCLYSHRAIC